MKRTVAYPVTAGAYEITFYDAFGNQHRMRLDIEGTATITVDLDTLETSDITEIPDATQDQTHGSVDGPGNRD
jgi:hypothetical protein